MILQMSSEHAVEHMAMTRPRKVKWSRGRRLAVALASATVSWGLFAGAGYLLVQIF